MYEPGQNFYEKPGFQRIQETRIMFPQQKFPTIIDSVEAICLNLGYQLTIINRNKHLSLYQPF